MQVSVSRLLPLLCLLAVMSACRDAGTALSLTVKLQGPAQCVRVTATGGSPEALTSDIPLEPGADFRSRALTVALYPGGTLGHGNVTLLAQGFAGSCDTAATQETRRTVPFVEGKVTPVLLELQLLDGDSDGDGVPDGQDCAPGDGARFPRPGNESGPECGNGADDDCDGAVDDGCPCDATRPCYPDSHAGSAGVGSCTRGTQSCTGGTYGACEGYVLPSDDVCDGADNDCDGTVDNGCGCDEGAERPCYSAGPPALAGLGACIRGTQRCTDGSWSDCAGDVAPAAESCNGADDDCDGLTDELPDVPTAPCGLQQGVCAGSHLACGQQACTQAEYAAAAGTHDAGYTSQEGAAHCDGLDNDCDGIIDEDCPCPAGATEPCHPLGLSFAGLGKGNCKAGERTCQADGGWSGCVGAVEPQPETCNGLDDDCDGAEDDDPADAGQPCSSGAKGVCAPGTYLCSGGGLLCTPDTAPSAETCDGLDDDCDGLTDEEFPGLGQSCMPGVGACARTGVIQCQPDGGFGCSVDAGLPRAETCNAVDDDCDGAPDEDFPSLGTLCSTAYGACVNNGTIVCLPDGGSGCTAPVPVPVTETCNGLDDDCDGQKDEDFPNIGQACSNGKTGACAASGTWSCLPNGGFACTAPDVQPGTESCNGIDDDCDSLTDEGFSLGQPCGIGVGSCARTGVIACKGDGTSGCNAPVIPPGTESCNGADDDCDGAVDEDFLVGQPCSVGVGACARTGTWACNGSGGATCSGAGGVAVSAGSPAREVCDNKDNDCDGATDEWPECGGPRADVAEDAANTWAFSDSNSDSPNYCSGPLLTRGSMASGGAAENVTTGSTSARVIYTYTAYFQARYPVGNNGNWDLSTTTGVHFNAKHLALPSGVTWQLNGPLVVLCGAAGSYRVYTPVAQRLSTGFQTLDVPLAGQVGAWSTFTVGSFSLSQVNSIEFHANPAGNGGGATLNLYYDDVRFY